MWTAPYRVTFAPPAGLEDWTHYSFTEPTGRESVEVGYGAIPNSASTARDVLVQRRMELDDLKEHDPAFRISPIADTAVGTLAGSMLNFTAHEQHFEFREWWAIALLEVSYVQIAYRAPGKDTAAESRMRSILASATSSGAAPAAAPARPGFTRHRAGRVSLDVPNRLAPPSEFFFATGDGSVKLSFTVYASPTIWSFPAGEMQESASEMVVIDHIPATVQRFVLVRSQIGDDQRWAYRRCQIVFDDGVTVQIEGYAADDLASALDRHFGDFIRSVRQSD